MVTGDEEQQKGEPSIAVLTSKGISILELDVDKIFLDLEACPTLPAAERELGRGATTAAAGGSGAGNNARVATGATAALHRASLAKHCLLQFAG